MEYGYLDKEVKALVAERDRLAAENSEQEARIAELETALTRETLIGINAKK